MDFKIVTSPYFSYTKCITVTQTVKGTISRPCPPLVVLAEGLYWYIVAEKLLTCTDHFSNSRMHSNRKNRPNAPGALGSRLLFLT